MDQQQSHPPPSISDVGEYSSSTHNQQLLDDAAKRRSSSRSIKRRKFDDELVEYSLTQPGISPSMPRVEKKVRTQSYSSPYTEMTVTSTVAAAVAPAPVTPDGGKRRSGRPSAGGSVNRRSKKKGPLNAMSTKDLGRWKPADDLALIIGVQQTNDLRTVHRGVKFSCRFTVAELQSRWYALLYNAEVSRVAAAALRNLHPDLVAAVHAAALYSTAEEDMLGTIACTSLPTLERFQELLDGNPGVFYPARTAKALQTHWQLLKQYQLLPDQTVKPLPSAANDYMMAFSEAEDNMNDNDLQEPRDEDIDVEMQLVDRAEKREIRLLENSINRWQVLVQSVVGGNSCSGELDRNTVAVLRGRHVRYLMRSREIVVGRSTRDQAVDVDLSLEGPAARVSRRHASIRLRNNGDFFVSCEGKRPLFVDGRPLLQGDKFKLNHNTVIELSGLRFVFLVNHEHINALRQDAVKANVQS